MSQDMNQQKDERNTGQETIKPPVKRKKRRHRFGAGMAVGALAVLLIGACAWGVKVYLYGGFPFDTYASGEVSEDDVAVKLDLLNSLIDRYYLYGDQIDEDALTEGIYSGYAAALGDP